MARSGVGERNRVADAARSAAAYPLIQLVLGVPRSRPRATIRSRLHRSAPPEPELPKRARVREVGDDHSDFVPHVLAQLEDELARSRKREAFWISVVVHICFVLLVIYSPELLPNWAQPHLLRAEDLARTKEPTFLALPQDMQKASKGSFRQAERQKPHRPDHASANRSEDPRYTSRRGAPARKPEAAGAASGSASAATAHAADCPAATAVVQPAIGNQLPAAKSAAAGAAHAKIPSGCQARPAT